MYSVPHLPPVAAGIVAISAVALAIVRLLTASRPFWASTPAWLQKALPALLMAIAALPTAIESARSWLDVVVAAVISVSMYWTASRGDKRTPIDKSGAPRTERVKSDPKIPGGDALLLALLCGALISSPVLYTACAAPALSAKRCDFQNPEYTAHVAMCRQEIEATCLLADDNTPQPDCLALVKCEAWRKEQCQ